MDYYDWSPVTAEHSKTDLVGLSLLSVEIADSGVLWNQYLTLNTFYDTSTNSLLDDPFNSPESPQSNNYTIRSESSVTDKDSITSPKSMDRECYTKNLETDTTLNRVQRRRTQNRNSQRVYRQRRIEERRAFETRAMEAEETSKQLRVHLKEVQSVVASFQSKIQQLEAENMALRNGTYTMNWSKSSVAL